MFNAVIGFQGRKKICEGKNASMVLEEELQHLAEKLEKLQRNLGIKDSEVRNTSNFYFRAFSSPAAKSYIHSSKCIVVG